MYLDPGDYVDSRYVDGYDRWFTIHIPPGYQLGDPMPLVVNLHSFMSTMFIQEEMSRMNAKADKEGFITVHLQALGEPPAWWGYLPGIPDKLIKIFLSPFWTI